MRKTIIWVISPFSNPAKSESTDRFLYICKELTKKGAAVSQFISSFDHELKKRGRTFSTPWHCVKVFEPGYKRNVSVRRLLSHIAFDFLLPFYFIREAFHGGIPDTIFTVLPHNGASCVAVLFAKLFRARLIVDIHDTWPESILSVTKINFVMFIIYHLWKACADFSILCADDVFGESELYAERANVVREKFGRSSAQAIYLGGDPKYYKKIEPVQTMPKELENASFIVAYAGTLGENYDLDCVIDTFAVFEKECPEAGLMLLGGGEREAEIKSRLSELGLRGWISGRIPYRVLVSYLKHAHIGLNCFKAGGNVAYSYKLNDYLLIGVPVINSLQGESADIISLHGLGINYSAGDADSMLNAIRVCYTRWAKDLSWAEKVVAFSSQFLDRSKSYHRLIQSCLDNQRKG